MNTDFELFPESASTAAGAVDGLYLFMVALSTVLTVLIAGLVIYFAVKYRRNNLKVDRAQLPTSMKMELSWMLMSLPILMGIFVWGAKVCFDLFRPPAITMPITVVAKQWMWKFQHQDGRREIDALHVPIGQPVKLTMISQDVIHSFFVPAFRVKQDVLPGRYTTVWFEATKPGDYRLYCAEYCGTNHSRMIGRVVAMTPDSFAAWLAGRSGSDEPPEVAGQKLFEAHQCASCHRATPDAGIPARGPALEGLAGKRVPLKAGATVVADDAYLRESILRPAAKVVAGYEPIMPAFETELDEDKVLQLIAYIKSLNEESDSPPSKGGARGGIPNGSDQGDSAASLPDSQTPLPTSPLGGEGPEP